MIESNPFVKKIQSNWSLNCMHIYHIDPQISENTIKQVLKFSQQISLLLEQRCFTSHLLSFDNNKVLKIINWIC